MPCSESFPHIPHQFDNPRDDAIFFVFPDEIIIEGRRHVAGKFKSMEGGITMKRIATTSVSLFAAAALLVVMTGLASAASTTSGIDVVKGSWASSMLR